MNHEIELAGIPSIQISSRALYRILGMHLTIWPMVALAIGGVAHGLVAMF